MALEALKCEYCWQDSKPKEWKKYPKNESYHVCPKCKEPCRPIGVFGL